MDKEIIQGMFINTDRHAIDVILQSKNWLKHIDINIKIASADSYLVYNIKRLLHVKPRLEKYISISIIDEQTENECECELFIKDKDNFIDDNGKVISMPYTKDVKSYWQYIFETLYKIFGGSFSQYAKSYNFDCDHIIAQDNIQDFYDNFIIPQLLLKQIEEY